MLWRVPCLVPRCLKGRQVSRSGETPLLPWRPECLTTLTTLSQNDSRVHCHIFHIKCCIIQSNACIRCWKTTDIEDGVEVLRAIALLVQLISLPTGFWDSDFVNPSWKCLTPRFFPNLLGVSSKRMGHARPKSASLATPLASTPLVISETFPIWSQTDSKTSEKTKEQWEEKHHKHQARTFSGLRSRKTISCKRCYDLERKLPEAVSQRN